MLVVFCGWSKYRGGRDGNGNGKGEVRTNEVHEILQHSLEMRVSRNRNRDVHRGTHSGPHESRHTLCPSSTQDLDRKTHGVDIRAVVRNNAQTQYNEAEFAKTTERPEENGGKKTTGSRSRVSVSVLVYAVVEGGRCHDGNAEHFCEEKGHHEADPDGEEDLSAGLVGRLINSVISSVAGPSRSEAVNNASEGEHRAEFRSADAHGDVDEVARVRENAQDDDEDDGGRDPGPEFVDVHNLVAEECYEECADGDYNDARVARHVVVHGVNELGTDDGVDAGPAKTGEDVEDGDWGV